MLQRWLKRTRCTGVGACSIVAVDAVRSSSKPILGVNVDEPLLAAAQRPPRIVDSATILAASDHVFVGRNDRGLTVAIVVRQEERRRTAMRLGRMILACCGRLNQIGDAVRQHWRGVATIVAVDSSDACGWNIQGGATRLLAAKAGLLIVSAEHSNVAPLPGNGWLIEKLSRLDAQKRISANDVERSLSAARIGGPNSSTIVVESPTNDGDVLPADFAVVRKSA
jgi:hypothetical protein